ncbi:hypothetical protein B0T11DRAFT_279355 [Plectosphaerella cucumerina]|uniref:Uncharacterized protein n=1 Tax=Plectosphaerella cucumerina TaxID=40658 RepID=A0A8K0X301_9PEZI|nr:hypothetical protein B0T11DRAFT_279355 [Plectosphaerella cucumerina]
MAHGLLLSANCVAFRRAYDEQIVSLTERRSTRRLEAGRSHTLSAIERGELPVQTATGSMAASQTAASGSICPFRSPSSLFKPGQCPSSVRLFGLSARAALPGAEHPVPIHRHQHISISDSQKPALSSSPPGQAEQAMKTWDQTCTCPAPGLGGHAIVLLDP